MTLALEPFAPLGALALAWLLDVAVGEPPGAVHPVVWMGRTIRPLTRLARRTPASELAIGGLYAFTVIAGWALVGVAVLRLRARAPLVAFALETYLLWSAFALRALLQAGAAMDGALGRADLSASREALRSLCSRDPSQLSAEELAGATIESLTENASDSVVAPLLFYALGGLPWALAYRAANTLDAMVGYHGRYEYLGKVAARVDDLFNLVPARLTAFFLALAGALRGLPLGRGVRVWRRDARRTESPNAGHPMAMAAGLVGARLDKRGAYALGDDQPPPDRAALSRTLGLVRAAGWLAALACVILLGLRGV